jgi:hypothetical protein
MCHRSQSYFPSNDKQPNFIKFVFLCCLHWHTFHKKNFILMCVYRPITHVMPALQETVICGSSWKQVFRRAKWEGRLRFHLKHFLILMCNVSSVHDMKAYMGSRGIAPFILNLGTTWWLTSRPSCFTPGKEPRHPLNGRQFEPQNEWMISEIKVFVLGMQSDVKYYSNLIIRSK